MLPLCPLAPEGIDEETEAVLAREDGKEMEEEAEDGMPVEEAEVESKREIEDIEGTADAPTVGSWLRGEGP